MRQILRVIRELEALIRANNNIDSLKLREWTNRMSALVEVQQSLEEEQKGLSSMLDHCEIHIKHLPLSREQRAAGIAPPRGAIHDISSGNYRVLVQIRGVYDESAVWDPLFHIIKQILHTGAGPS